MRIRLRYPLRVTLLYALFGGLWILVSDRLAAGSVSNPQLLLQINTYKGWAFIVVTAILLYLELHREYSRIGEMTATLQESEGRYQTLASISPVGIFRTDPNGATTYVNPKWCEISGVSFENALGDGWLNAIHPDDREKLSKGWQGSTQLKKASFSDYRFVRPDGTIAWVMGQAIPETNSANQIIGYVGTITDITERKRAEEKLLQSHELLRNLASLVPGVIYQYRLYPDGRSTFPYSSPGMNDIYEVTPEDVQEDASPVFGRLHPDDYDHVANLIQESARTLQVFYCEFRVILPRQGLRWRWSQAHPERMADGGTLWHGIILDITERKRAEDELREKEQLLSEAQSIGHIGSWSYDLSTDTLQFSEEIFRLLNVSSQDFQYDIQSLLELVYSMDRPNVSKWVEELQTNKYSKTVDFRIFRANGEMRHIQVRGAFVNDRDGKSIRFAGTAQDVTERMLSEIQIRQQIERLTALRKIDQTIVSSKNLKSTLQVILAEVLKQLQVDATDILLLSPDGILLKHAADMGFRANAIRSTVVRMGEGHAGRAAKERRLIHVENLKDEPDNKLPASLLSEENFVCYYGIPLIAKKKVLGVLEIFHRVSLQPYAEWLDFLDLLAGQAAIAIDNAGLFEDLQISNSELTHAYEATIEGWSRALDLRDKETEGHTQRVTEKTLELARLMGLPDDELVHIRRGALLHDIGKMGVPDEILFKADNLSAEEWEIMKKHPIFAYDMLSPIYYIKSAGIDIPYCHHEKWDGTGYPRGLKGEEIPQAARIFAIIDVWDAITSDRPYRPAWTKEKALDYIEKQSGKQFDPRVVHAFLKLIS